MKRKPQQTSSSSSLRTFYVYALLVFIVICIALLIRAFVLFQQSRFDTNNHFTFALLDKGSVKEVISINPQIPAITKLIIEDNRIPYTVLAKDYGIGTDGFIESNSKLSLDQDLQTIMWQALKNPTGVTTNLTIFDFMQIIIVSNNVTTGNTGETAISLQKQDQGHNTTLIHALTDPVLASESISIQIINATEIGGLGQRLGRVLTNRGANVVDVTSSEIQQKNSQIAYYGRRSYTLQRIEDTLHFPSEQITQQPIADIVITLGDDSRNTDAF